MVTSRGSVREVGVDAVALKPAEVDVGTATDLAVDTVAVDYEGREHLPTAETLDRLAAETDLVVTTPVRAEGFDPLGDDSLTERIPETARRALVAGHPTYLTAEERRKAVAPRLQAALEVAPDAWVGTEGVERAALAAGGTQYELLSRSTDREVRALREVGYDGSVAVYAPTVLTDDEDAILNAVGDYVARRGPVREALPTGAATDAGATGRAREVLLSAARDYALVGSPAEVATRIDDLREAGVNAVVAYPARGLAAFRDG